VTDFILLLVTVHFRETFRGNYYTHWWKRVASIVLKLNTNASA